MKEKWSKGKTGGCVVSDTPNRHTRDGHVDYYGGHLVAESIPKQEHVDLIAAAPELLAALKEEHGWDDPLHLAAQPDCWKCAAIAKAKGEL